MNGITESLLDELDAAGWQVVPKEPTRAMIAAGWSYSRADAVDETYKRMLGAAPRAGGKRR